MSKHIIVQAGCFALTAACTYISPTVFNAFWLGVCSTCLVVTTAILFRDARP